MLRMDSGNPSLYLLLLHFIMVASILAIHVWLGSRISIIMIFKINIDSCDVIFIWLLSVFWKRMFKLVWPLDVTHFIRTEIFDVTALIKYLAQGISPALPESLKLYRRLLRLGFRIVLLTGRMESSRNFTESNLKNVGYHTWEKLILR